MDLVVSICGMSAPTDFLFYSKGVKDFLLFCFHHWLGSVEHHQNYTGHGSPEELSQ